MAPSLIYYLKIAIVLAAVIAVVVVAIRAMGVNIPAWAVQIFWIVIIAIVALIAVAILISFM